MLYALCFGVVCSGLVWSDVEWCGVVVWCGVVCSGVVWSVVVVWSEKAIVHIFQKYITSYSQEALCGVQ